MNGWVARLREALQAARFTVEAVTGLLGVEAHAALERNETTPGRRRTGDGSALATLTRLFLLQVPVGVEAAERALPGLLDDLVGVGLLARSGAEYAARLDLRPYADDRTDRWLVSDLTPGLDGARPLVGADHVLGVSPASRSLAQLTIRDPIGAAWDLGCGCGVQALHLADHSDRVLATDVNPRARWMTEINAALNLATGVEVGAGSLFEPVAGRTFDLIATNPPFVISPATGERLVYRDSGLPGDQVVAEIVRGAPDRLNPGGWCQILANWAIVDGEPWTQRLESWLDDRVDSYLVQREVLDPAAYVELWLKDAGRHGAPDYLQRYDAWLAWLAGQRIEGIGFGWINLRARDSSGAPVRQSVDWPYAVEQPIAWAVAGWAEGAAAAAWSDRQLLAARLLLRSDVTQQTDGPPGAADPAAIVLRQQRGLRRARTVDTALAGLAGACDGELPVGAILAALAEILDLDLSVLAAGTLPGVRDLLAEGFLTPSGPLR